MRASLRDPALERHAGRFVWLELDYDREENQAFFARHGVAWTPELFVLDPADGRVLAHHVGGLPIAELERFLELGGGDRVEDEVSRLEVARDWRGCAERAAAAAPLMPRSRAWATVVRAGLGCANGAKAAGARTLLEPLAAAAADLPATLRDDRWQLYQQLMVAAKNRADPTALSRWGERWLGEIDATTPKDDDERSALDIARVDAVEILEQPARALPALEASEKAMPDNYTASARVARIAESAGRHDLALAAVARGLPRATGFGRIALLRIRAAALTANGDRAAARRALDDALRTARHIGNAHMREHMIMMIKEGF